MRRLPWLEHSHLLAGLLTKTYIEVLCLVLGSDLINRIRDWVTVISTQSNQKPSKSVKLDYFLYSCFEFEQTCKANPGRSLGDERWPPMVSHFEGEGSNFAQFGKLADQLRACLNWYKEKFPNLSIQQQLNLANISGIIPAVVFIGLDLKILYEHSDEYEKLIYVEANPDLRLWGELEKIIRETLPYFASEIISYLKWIYLEKQPVHWEVGSRPPVGRYAPTARRGRSSGPGGGRERFGGQKSGNRSSGAYQKHRPASSRNQDRHRSGGASSNQQKEKQALHLVEDAVKELKSNPKLGEIRLPPANSFYRRLQHKHAMTLGFYSESTGEGLDRSVVVMRQKRDHEEPA